MTRLRRGSSSASPRDACVMPPAPVSAAATNTVTTARGGTAAAALGLDARGIAVLASLVAVGAAVTAADGWIGRSGEGAADVRAAAPRRVEVPVHRIDIDRADVAELALLPETGPAIAARIAADRAVHGAFGSIDALGRVEGIGPARLAAIRDVAIASGAGSFGSVDGAGPASDAGARR